MGIFLSITLSDLMDHGRIFIFTGPNGSGKTRYLEHISNAKLYDVERGIGNIQRVVCLAGTVLDRFPSTINDDPGYAYFGRRVGRNLISEVAPYRRLASFLLERSSDWPLRAKAAKNVLASLGFAAAIHFRFRWGRNGKDRTVTPDKRNLDLKIPFDELELFDDAHRERLEQLKSGLVHVAGVEFWKGDELQDIGELSSGERRYILTVLALAFSVIDESVVLFDEPENSLHPKWQESIVRDVQTIINAVAKNVRLIIATHSPLIVSGAGNVGTYICDLERPDQGWVPSLLYGNSSDVVLKDQFGLLSPRSISFVSAIRRCLKALIMVNFEPQRFKEMADELLTMRVRLDPEDPLYSVFQDIKNAREKIS